MLRKLISFFFPSPDEIHRRQMNAALAFAAIFRRRLPESFALMQLAANDPDELVATWKTLATVDGRSLERRPGSIYPIDDIHDIVPEYLLRDLYFPQGVVAEVDWKAHYNLVVEPVKAMLSGYGHDGFDWSWLPEVDDEISAGEFVFLLDDRLKGTGYRLAYLNFGQDSHAFFVVGDADYRQALKIDMQDGLY